MGEGGRCHGYDRQLTRPVDGRPATEMTPESVENDDFFKFLTPAAWREIRPRGDGI